MKGLHLGLMLSLFMAVVLYQEVSARAYIETKLTSYRASCYEFFGLNKCDPKFTVCMDRKRKSTAMTPCRYTTVGESGHFQDQNLIDFDSMSNIKGIPNPIIVRTELKGTTIMVVFRVRDDNLFVDDELVVMGNNLDIVVYPSQSDAVWTDFDISKNIYTISFKIRVYCEAHYYGPLCSTYCHDADDFVAGHYTCEPSSGNKTCLQGWTGVDCLDDINECLLSYCQKGTCKNTPGAYFCTCPPNYSGKNCEIIGNPCDSQPCKKNSTCINMKNGNFTCVCPSDWEGQLCDVRLNPCKSSPCKNGMGCISSFDNSYYLCDCKFPTTGVNCESILADNTINLTTITTTATSTTTTPDDYDDNAALNAAKHDHDNSSGFLYWHAILLSLAGLILLALVILCICLVMRRRRMKEKLKNSAYENNVYNKQTEAMMFESQTKKQPPSINSENYPPAVPVFVVTDINDLGLVKDDNRNIILNNDELSRQVKLCNKKNYENIVKRLMSSEKAETNPYTGNLNGDDKMEKSESFCEDPIYNQISELDDYTETDYKASNEPVVEENRDVEAGVGN